MWLGLEMVEDKFMRVDGNEVDYEHWAIGQPDLVPEWLENCAAISDLNNNWHDLNC